MRDFCLHKATRRALNHSVVAPRERTRALIFKLWFLHFARPRTMMRFQRSLMILFLICHYQPPPSPLKSRNEYIYQPESPLREHGSAPFKL